MKHWYNYSWNDVVKQLNGNMIRGLTDDIVSYNRKLYGNNSTLNLKSRSFIIIFIKCILKIYFIIGILISSLLFYTGQRKVSISLIVIVLLSIFIYALKEYINENRLKHLQKITPKKANVLRNGKTTSVFAEELVIGDIVYLDTGDIVPADLRLIECENLKIKESAVTGNNEIIEKYQTKIEDREISPGEMKNIAFKSSFVIDGTGKGIVVAVGENTHIGNITKDLVQENYEINDFQDNVSTIVNYMSIFFIILSGLISIIVFFTDKDIKNLVYLISIIYFTLVPIEIIVIINLLFYIVNKNSKKEKIEFKGISSIQTLGNTNVIFINKVGTITEDNAYVSKIFSNGTIIDMIPSEVEKNKDNINRLINIGLLCNDVKLDGEEKVKKGSLLERALVSYGKEFSWNKKKLDIEQERMIDIPFDWDKRIKTTVNKIDDKYRANVVGLVDKLLERCTHIMKNGIEVEITQKDIDSIKDADLILSSSCLYVTGFAYRNFSYLPSINENIESNLVFVGLVGVENPTKENCLECIDYCKSLAIKPILITNDNLIAAKSIGNKVKILNKNDLALSGVEIDNMNDDDLEKFVERVGTYSRISHKNKWRIANEFRKLGYNLAVTGNRFIDLPSFRAAHVGIATGKECTNIAKRLADIFIENNDFINLLNIIDKSRKFIRCMKNIILFILAIGIIQVLTILFSSVVTYEKVFELSKFIFINYGTLVLTSLLIFSQYKKIEGNNYECSKIDKSIFKEFSSGLIICIVGTVFISFLTFYLQNKNGIYIASSSLFTILNLSTIFLGFYFIKFTDVIKDKISSLILFLSIVYFLIIFKVFYFKDFIYLLKCNFIQQKTLLVALVSEIILITLGREIDRN